MRKIVLWGFISLAIFLACAMRQHKPSTSAVVNKCNKEIRVPIITAAPTLLCKVKCKEMKGIFVCLQPNCCSFNRSPPWPITLTEVAVIKDSNKVSLSPLYYSPESLTVFFLELPEVKFWFRNNKHFWFHLYHQMMVKVNVESQAVYLKGWKGAGQLVGLAQVFREDLKVLECTFEPQCPGRHKTKQNTF